MGSGFAGRRASKTIQPGNTVLLVDREGVMREIDDARDEEAARLLHLQEQGDRVDMVALSRRLEHHPDPMDVSNEFCVIQRLEQRQIDLVGQQQIIQLVFNFKQLRQRECLTLQTQINIRTRTMVALGA